MSKKNWELPCLDIMSNDDSLIVARLHKGMGE